MTEVLEKVNWRARAKELGVPLHREPRGSGMRKKVDVLADIQRAEVKLEAEKIVEEHTEVPEVARTADEIIALRLEIDRKAELQEHTEVPVLEPIQPVPEIDYTEIRNNEIRGVICKIMSKMLDNPDENGIYPTSRFMWEMETYILSLTQPTSTTIVSGAGITIIEPVPEHDRWQNNGRPTEVEPLMRRIETLEDRVNRLIEAISKSKKVKGI